MTYYRKLIQNHQTKKKNRTHFKMASRASHVYQVQTTNLNLVHLWPKSYLKQHKHFHIIKAEIGLKKAIPVDTVDYCNVQPQISFPAPLTEYIHLCNSGLSRNAVNGLDVIGFLLSMTSNSQSEADICSVQKQQIPPSFLWCFFLECLSEREV